MHSFESQLKLDRLFLASEAILHVLDHIAETPAAQKRVASNLRSLPAPPESLSRFTRTEIDEAIDFLVRLGYLPATIDTLH